MGTLLNQPERNYREVEFKDIMNEISRIKAVSARCDLSIPNIIKIIEILETRRRNDLFVANGDIFDEQMSGFGELLKEITLR